jgi:hypothetical protein
VKSITLNTLVCVAAFVVAFLIDLQLVGLWRQAFVLEHPYPATFGLIRWGQLVQWTYSAIFGLVLVVILASLIRGPSKMRWVVGFGACFGLLQFIIAGHQFTSAASFVDRAWTYMAYVVPVIAMWLGAKVRLGSTATRAVEARNPGSIGIIGRRLLICVVVFIAVAAANELLRRKWNGLFGDTFTVYYGWFSGIYAVQYLFDLLLFGLVGALIGFLFPSPASTRWAVGLGIFFGFARSLQFTHDFTAAARWYDYAAAYGQYFIPAVGAYLGVVISRLRKAPSHGSGAA